MQERLPHHLRHGLRYLTLLLNNLLFICVFLSGSAWSQKSPYWRFWTAEDGLGESFSSSVTISHNGNIWVNHGDIEHITRLDGYIVHNILSPGTDVKVFENRFGQIWSINKDGFIEFKDGEWISYPINEFSEIYEIDGIDYEALPFFPINRDQIIFLLPNRLMLYNASTKEKILIKHVDDTHMESFINMTVSCLGEICITGKKGITIIHQIEGQSVIAAKWNEYAVGSSLGLVDFQEPVDTVDGGFLIIASDMQKGKKVLVKFTADTLNILSQNIGDMICCWPDNDNGFWASEFPSQHLARILANGDRFTVENDSLSGSINDVALDVNGVFWLGTSQNLARYAPPLWSTPVSIDHIKSIVHAIREDEKGRLWFAATDRLVLLQDEIWKVYPLPDAMRSDFTTTQCLCILPDGRIVIQTRKNSKDILVFNPQTEQFEIEKQPERRKVRFISQSRGDDLWLQTGSSSDYRLELFDGVNFRSVLDLGDQWNIDNLRYLHETNDGDLWIGGTGGLALYSDGKYSIFDNSKGFSGDGAFIIEQIGEGKIWIGDRSKIYEFDGEHFTEIWDGLDKGRSMIASSNGNVWVAAGNGLHRQMDNSWITYTVEDGLPSTITYTVFEDSKGRIWSGTARGIGLFNPNADNDPPETIMDFDKSIDEVPPIGDALIFYSGIDKWKFTEEHRLLFSYRLDNSPWSLFSEKKFTFFKGLSYGDHFFEVRVMDRNGNIDPTPANFNFTVLLPWYREAGFIIFSSIGMIIIFLLLGYAITRYLWLEKLIELHTAELTALNLSMEQEITESEERYRVILEDSPVLICRFLPNGKIVFVNKAFCKYFGKTPEVLIGSNFMLMIPDEVREEVMAKVTALKAESPTQSYEYQVIAPGVDIRWQRWTYRALFDSKGQTLAYQSIGEDITEHKRAEEELFKARKLESIGILAGGIAHDFNNLLTAIIGNNSLVKMLCKSSSKVTMCLNEVEKAAFRAQGLTQQLLTFSKGGAPVKESANVIDLIKDTATFSLRGSNVSCVFRFQEDLWLVNVDKGQFSQVIQNLVINANQAMPDGGTIEIIGENIRLSDDDVKNDSNLREGDYVKLSIKDQGTGILKEHLQKLFDPYFTTKPKGNGLGLATTYSIMKNHDGIITVESQIGTGTTFTLYLPIATVKTLKEQVTVQKKNITCKGRILIMDDEKMIRDVAGNILSQMGYEVYFAKEGNETIKKYLDARDSGNPINILIMDLTIPGGMGGEETLKRLLDIDPLVKAVVSSGYSGDPIMAEYKKYGFVGVISKPYNIEELGIVLQNVLSE